MLTSVLCADVSDQQPFKDPSHSLPGQWKRLVVCLHLHQTQTAGCFRLMRLKEMQALTVVV